jgi:hypothetical protein
MQRLKPIKIRFIHFDDPGNERESDAVYFRIFDVSIKNLLDKRGKAHIIKSNKHKHGNN